MDGRPLTGRYVVGRADVGGSEVALPREALNEIATAGTGRPILVVPQSKLGNSVGDVRVNRYSRMPELARVSEGLTPPQLEKVTGRVIDQVAGEIPGKWPDGVPTYDSGRLKLDMDGRPFTARHVVGRAEVGASDVALPREALNEIATAGTGSPILAVPQSELGRDVGSVTVARFTRRPTMARVSEKLSPPQLEKVAGHEIGHVIDQVAGEIPVTGLNAELRQLYNTLQSGTERTRNLVEPKHWGYKGDEIPREYMAEAIRAYVTDPNSIKTVAARIGDAAPPTHGDRRRASPSSRFLNAER